MTTQREWSLLRDTSTALQEQESNTNHHGQLTCKKKQAGSPKTLAFAKRRLEQRTVHTIVRVGPHSHHFSLAIQKIKKTRNHGGGDTNVCACVCICVRDREEDRVRERNRERNEKRRENNNKGKCRGRRRTGTLSRRILCNYPPTRYLQYPPAVGAAPDDPHPVVPLHCPCVFLVMR